MFDFQSEKRYHIFMKNLLKTFFIMLCCFAFLLPTAPYSYASAENTQNTYIVAANSANLYDQPSLVGGNIVGKLNHKDEVFLKMEGSQPKTFGEDETYVFFQLDPEYHSNIDGDVFILAQLLIPKSNEIVSIPSFNAKTNSDCKVFFSPDEETGESDIVLKKGTQLFLYEGYNRKNTFTAVAFVNETEVVYGYLKTSAISPNGINPLIITCIVLTLAVLGIIFAWVFMKKSKVKLKGKSYNLKKSQKE